MTFSVFGKTYENTEQLMHRQVGEYQSEHAWSSMPVYEDIYGCQVIRIRVRYPCFDSFDRLYENRYFRWYFIKCGQRVAVVYTDDGTGECRVLEDIPHAEQRQLRVSDWHIRELELAGFLEKR